MVERVRLIKVDQPVLWRWLMVGGPWHGQFKMIPRSAWWRGFGVVDVPDPQGPLTYEREPEFGVIASYREKTTAYRTETYDSDWNGNEVYIQALVVCSLKRGEAGPWVAESLMEAAYRGR